MPISTFSLAGSAPRPWCIEDYLMIVVFILVFNFERFLRIHCTLHAYVCTDCHSLKRKYHANLLSFQNLKMFVCQQKRRNNCQVCYKLSPQCNKTVD